MHGSIKDFFFFQIIFTFFSFLILFVSELLDPLTVVRALFLNKMSPVLSSQGQSIYFLCALSPCLPFRRPGLQRELPHSMDDPEPPVPFPQKPRSRARVLSRPSEMTKSLGAGSNSPGGKELSHPAGLWACLYDWGRRVVGMAPIPSLFIP